ncbi:MAG TPA: DoxX family protein [Verrucomicrobiae bacterium]|jgi:putative oxidoreductase
MIKKIFAPGNDSVTTNLGLLVLRLWFGLTMCLHHGVDKIHSWDKNAPIWLDPFHVGHQASYAMTIFAEAICSFLLALGLVTRFAALVLIINMTVAFTMVHKEDLKAGELAYVYLGVFVVLFVAGAGKFSLDKALFGKGGKSGSPAKKN